MGHEYIKRPLRVVNSTSLIPGVDFSGTVALSAGLVLPTETLTAGNSMQTLSANGISFVTSTAGAGLRGGFRLPNPPAAGAVKIVVCDIAQANATAHDDVFNFCTFTTAAANNFWGSTSNGIKAVASGSTVGGDGNISFTLFGVTTAVWAVDIGSTGIWDVAGSTGSTAGP